MQLEIVKRCEDMISCATGFRRSVKFRRAWGDLSGWWTWRWWQSRISMAYEKGRVDSRMLMPSKLSNFLASLVWSAWTACGDAGPLAKTFALRPHLELILSALRSLPSCSSSSRHSRQPCSPIKFTLLHYGTEIESLSFITLLSSVTGLESPQPATSLC